MKLASYNDGSRDGQLVVVSRDLTTAHYANGIATRMQQVLDDWGFLSPQLEDLSTALNQGRARHAFAFDPTQCMAPLPRASQWVAGQAYLEHITLSHRARGSEPPNALKRDPVLRLGSADALLGPCDDIVVPSEKMGADFAAQLAVITGDVPLLAKPEQALEGVRLLMLANEVCLRHLAEAECERGVPPSLSQPATAFSPVAVTPDELQAAWQGGRVQLSLQCQWNGKRVGLLDAGAEMQFHFGQLLAQLCKTRPVHAGSLMGSGCVSHADASLGFASIADKRAREVLEHGQAQTEFLRYGDSIRIEMKGLDGHSLFGAIDQTVVAPQEGVAHTRHRGMHLPVHPSAVAPAPTDAEAAAAR